MSFKDVLNKHYGHTQNSVKKYEVGGKVVTKNGATNDAKKGGYFDGRPHSKGGIKAINIDTDQPIEVEGGEVVITKRAVADKSKKEFEGQMMTNKEILSKINQSGGGVAFEHGGEIDAEEMADLAGNTALGAEMQFKQGGEFDDDDYDLSDDDFDFDIDIKEFEDGGLIPIVEQRIFEIFLNSRKREIPYSELSEKYQEKFPTEYNSDDFLFIILGMTESNLIKKGKNGYKLTPDGFDKIEEIRKANLNTKTPSLPENQQRILEIIINSNKQELTYPEIRDKYLDKFPSSGGITEVDDAISETINSNLIILTSGKNLTYKIAPLGFEKIEEIRKENLQTKTPSTNQTNQPLEIESIRVLISDIKDPEGSKNGIKNKYRGPYQKIFEDITTFDNVEEDIVYYGKDGGDVNDFYVKIINPKFKIDFDSAINKIKKSNRVSITDITYKNSSSSQGVQVNPLFEEFPYFAPDAVKEYNPSVLTVETRAKERLLKDAEFNEINRQKRKNIEIFGQLINDIPVENVVERTQLALGLNKEEQELQLMQNETLLRIPILTYIDSNGYESQLQRRVTTESLEGLIAMATEEEIGLTKFRPSEYLLLSTFTDMLHLCVDNSYNFITNWVINFFGNWIKFSQEYGNSYSYLSNPDNVPSEISKVGRAVNLHMKDYYAPIMVYQGLSQPYDRVGFDIFPISYYAVNYSYANWFAETKGERLNTDGVILPCILNIRRPLDLSMFGINKVSSKNFFDAVYLQTGLTPEDLKVNPAFLLENTPDLEVWVYIRNNPEMLKMLKESKIVDGIHMFENNPSVAVGKPEYETEVWITFYPEQTKVLPIFQLRKIFDGDRNKFDRGWFSKSQFLKWGGKL